MPEKAHQTVYNPHITEHIGEPEFLPEIDRDRINLTLGHVANNGHFPQDRLYQGNIDLAYQATHDPLTGLLNRRGFEDVFNRTVEASRDDPNASFAVVFIDLDGFKSVNDTHGHDTGDKLLIEIAKRFRKGDILARYGGDEFVMLANVGPGGNHDRKDKTPDEAISGIVKHLKKDAIDTGLELGLDFRGASVGYAHVDGKRTLEELQTVADEMMYRNKDPKRANERTRVIQKIQRVIHRMRNK